MEACSSLSYTPFSALTLTNSSISLPSPSSIPRIIISNSSSCSATRRTRRRSISTTNPSTKPHSTASYGPELAQKEQKAKAVVVGGGWAGFGAAHALCKAGFAVTLLDAAQSPGGLSTGYRTAQGRPVEAGIKGFWWQYHNIYELVRELGIPWPFTDWTQSSFYSPNGILVESPVFNALPQLPTPLGSFIYTSPFFRSLSLVDRLTAAPLIKALIEFDVDEETYKKYDSMTARELFREAGISARLYKDFLEPILLVTLFAPPEKLSAAAALGALYYYVLAHQNDFDVRWCKGSVAELIFYPWLRVIENQGGRVLGGKRVQDVITCSDADRVTSVVAVSSSGDVELYEADVVIFAVGVQAMQRIVASSPVLARRNEFACVTNIGTVDVMAIRLWFDRLVKLQNPSNVLSGFEPTTGGTMFSLNNLQEEFSADAGSVIEVDLYHASQLIPLPDEAVIDRVWQRYLVKCEPQFEVAKVVDSSVLRFKGAVTLFGPGSHENMPSTCTSFANVFLAGDWLSQGPGSHGARGLSQEKAYVTGLQAANVAASSQSLKWQMPIVDVEKDEFHIAAAKSGVREYRKFLCTLGYS